MTTGAASRAGSPPLSAAQEALWYASLLEAGRLRYNETVSIRKDGPLDVAALRRAVAELIARHEAWRTTFDLVDGAPVQVVAPALEVRVPLIDLGHLTVDQAERQAVRLLADVARVPYDVRRGPLLRPRLVRFPGDHHRLYLALHHLTFDGVSLYRVVLPELVALYDAFRAGRPSPLPEPAAQYADYARFEQEWITQPRAARRIAWWRAALAAAPKLALPVDRPRAAEPRPHGGSHALEIPAATVARLQELARSTQTSLFQVLAATWAVLLGRWCGRDDVVFATVADLRQRLEFEGVVGYAVTPLVLRVDLTGDPSFAELVVRVRDALLDGLDHLVPFERLVRELDPDAAAAGAGANPVYQTLFVLQPSQPTPDPAWALHEMESDIGDAVGTTKVDLELQLDERDDGRVEGRLIYDRQLFATATAARLVEHWARIVGAVGDEPPAALAAIALVADDDDRALLRELHATTTDLAVSAATGEDPRRWVLEDVDAVRLRLDGPPPTDAQRDALRAAVWAGGAPGSTRRAAVVNAATAVATALGVGPADTVLVLGDELDRAPVLGVWLPLVAGARIVVAPAEAGADGAQVSRLIRAHGISLLHAAPATWQALVDTGLRPGRALRALCSGAPLSTAQAERILARSRVLWNAWGSPETADVATLGMVGHGEIVTVGRPVANTRVDIVDGRDRPVAIGLVGELVVRGASGAPGDAHRSGTPARWLADGRVQLA